MGPLQGFRVIELAGIGPGPFCGMMLSDMGAEVIRVDRVGGAGRRGRDVLARNRRSVAVDLKQPEGVELVLKLVETADALFEGFRPGVTERLGLGPDDCMARNEKLVYGRMTGWGQEGPIAHAAGTTSTTSAWLARCTPSASRAASRCRRSISSATSAAAACSWRTGWYAACWRASRSGKGQVIDAAMVDGAAALMAMFFSQVGRGFNDQRGSNMLDGGTHFYNTYETQDGKYVCVGSIEPQFYAELLEKSGVDASKLGAQMDAGQWVGSKETLAAVFKTKTATNGARLWRAATCALRRCYPSWKPPIIPTTSSAERSWTWTAWSSQRRRRALAALPRQSPTRRGFQGKTRTRYWRTSAWRPRISVLWRSAAWSRPPDGQRRT